ncbi:MAG: exosortase A [Pseudomonadota bacterium]
MSALSHPDSGPAMQGSVDEPDAQAKPQWSQPWRIAFQQLGILALLLVALFWRDLSDMALIWWDVSTYNHILLIPLILGWLVWQRADALRQTAPGCAPLALLWVALGALVWLLGEASGTALLRHGALVVMVQGAVVALLGWRAGKILWFPLFYGFFLVPVGEEIVPFLQTITADMSMVLLSWIGIPAFREGVFISTPTGYFEVAEACSGVKFLIAMIAYGVLVAYLCFARWSRRILFLAACVILPIIANGIRAWGTIAIAHYYGLDFAVGFDHVFYGWFFFALVMIIIMGAAWPFFDRAIDAPFATDQDKAATADTARRWMAPAVLALTALLVAPVGWSLVMANARAEIAESITLPKIPEWQQVEYAPRADWSPQQKGAAHTLLGSYSDSEGTKIDLFFALYDRQAEGAELIGYGQGAHDPASDWAWTASGETTQGLASQRLVAPGPMVRDAVTLYVYGDLTTQSASRIKLAMLGDRLLGSQQRAGVLIVSAEAVEETDASQAVERFIAEAGPLDSLALTIASGE